MMCCKISRIIGFWFLSLFFSLMSMADGVCQNRYNYFFETTGDILPEGELFLKYDMSKVTGIVFEEGDWTFEFSYKNGRRDGVSKRWKDGKIQDEYYFEKGKRNGRSREWAANGQLTFEGYYLNGEENGLFVWYSSYGKKIAEENFILGKKDGENKYYDDRGVLTQIDIYKDDKLISSKQFP